MLIACKVQVYTSKHQLNEIQRVASEYFGDPTQKQYTPKALLEALLVILQNRAKILPTCRMAQNSPDPDDDFIIAIALKSKADYLVTQNQKDIYQALMPKSAITKVVSVAGALKILRD